MERSMERSEPEKEDRSWILRKRVLYLVLFLLVTAFFSVMAWVICRPMLAMVREPEAFRAYVDQKGIMGVLLFLCAIVLQVLVAVIPGGPFQIAAGYAFGTFRGALISDLGTTLGSLLVFLCVRRFGMAFILLFFSKEKVESMSFLKTSEKSRLLLLILFLVPGTPKDLMSYVVGLTDLPLASWLFITAVGRFPAILLSTISGNSLLEQKYGLFVFVMALVLILFVAGSFFYRRWRDGAKRADPT